MAAAAGGDPAQWYERAYQEDSSDEEITLAYGKSLLKQGQVGAAIFILEPQVSAGKNSAQLREIYAEALLAAGRYAEAEPLLVESHGNLLKLRGDRSVAPELRRLGEFRNHP